MEKKIEERKIIEVADRLYEKWVVEIEGKRYMTKDLFILAIQDVPSHFNLVSQEDRNNPLINAARGRDACGINHDELNTAYEAQLKELQEEYDKLKQQADEMREKMISFHIEVMKEGLIEEGGSIWKEAYEPKIKETAYRVFDRLFNKP